MTQQIINIGAAPNDGEGDNLRTAFDKVNDNFSNVWAQGPVDSNVQIQGNTISTLQVNQDLALSPNGTGNIRLNNNTIPGANNTWFLGSVTNRWRGLYAGNITAGNLSISGIVDLSGDVTVGGNLTVVGNTIQIGNITTDTKTIQLANTATTDAAANGSGITVGANDDIATFLYDSANNAWTTNIGVSVGGPITGTSLAVSDATVYGNIAAINGNFTGNVSANYFAGDGSQLTGIETGVTISNTAPALGNGGVWWNTVDGRAYVKYNSQFIDLSPSLVPDPTTYVGNVVFDNLTIENVGNILPATSNVYSLGSPGFQWKDLYVSNNTIYINSVPVALGAGNVLTVNGEALLSNDSNTTITTTGNITADYFFGDGSQLTNLPFDATKIQSGTTEVTIPVANGVVDIFVNNNQASYQFNEYGQLTFSDGSAAGNVGVDTFGLAAIANSNVAIITDDGAGTYTWTFGTDGNLVTPANLVVGPSPAGGSSILQYDSALQVVGEGANAIMVMGWAANTNTPDSIAVVGFNTPYSNGAANTIIAVGNNATVVNYWNFDNTGNLTYPDGTITTGGAVYAAANASVQMISNNENTQVRVDDANVEIYTSPNGVTQYQWTFDNTGNLAVPGNINYSGDPSASPNLNDFFSITSAVDFAIVADSANTAPTWTFDATGNLTIPGTMIVTTGISGSGASPAPTISGFSSVSAVSLNASGNISATGNVSAGNIVVSPGIGTLVLGKATATGSPGLSSTTSLTFTANRAGTAKELSFNTSGDLSAPGNVSGGNLTTAGQVVATGDITGDILVSSNQSGLEGGEINLSLPAAANTTLSGNIVVIDSYGDRLRFFEGGGTTRGLYIDLANSPAGVGAAIGYRDIPQVTFNANATAALADAGKHYYSTTAGNLALTLPDNGNVAFATGTALTIVVNAAGNVLVNQGTGVSLYQAGSSTTGNRVVGAYGMATVMKVAVNTWVISGTGVY